jgi:phosphodiesterase/alkaline phosphatase D-like protein
MANMYKDTIDNEEADLIIHIGDHAYAEGDDDERRGEWGVASLLHCW